MIGRFSRNLKIYKLIVLRETYCYSFLELFGEHIEDMETFFQLEGFLIFTEKFCNVLFPCVQLVNVLTEFNNFFTSILLR